MSMGTVGAWRLVFVLWFTLAMQACLASNVSSSEQPTKWRWSDVDRVVVIPDIHGAYDALIELLRATDVVDETLRWSGGAAHLVSLGDLLDRGPDSRKVMDLLMRLQVEAKASGGYVHVVAGNHELMNLIGDLRYVSAQEFAAFAGEEDADARASAYSDFLSSREQTSLSDLQLQQAFDAKFPPGYFGHRAAFAPEGKYGGWLLSLPAAIVIDRSAFVHGGLPPLAAEFSLAEINSQYAASVRRYREVWRELVDRGVLPDDESEDAGELARSRLPNAESSDCVEARQAECEQIAGEIDSPLSTPDPEVVRLLTELIALSDAPVLSVDGPLWYRGAVNCRPILVRPVLDAALENLDVDRVVVGHTTIADARVRSMHDDRMVLLDTGMLVEYYNGRPAALIIDDGKDEVQYLLPTERAAIVTDQWPVEVGLTKAQLREALQNATVARVLDAGNDSSLLELIYDDKVINALFIPSDRNGSDRLELSADHLDQLLGFDLVPTTVAREIDGQAGALQLRFSDMISESERQQSKIGIGGWCSTLEQFQLMYAWDILTANTGRTTENVGFRRKLWELQLTDHSKAFATSKRLPKGLSPDTVTLAPGVYNSLAMLDEETLLSELDGLLSKRQIRALISRRDAMLVTFGRQ